MSPLASSAESRVLSALGMLAVGICAELLLCDVRVRDRWLERRESLSELLVR